ncbi:hypothetical protein [Nocardia sp. NBC_01009]|uniref:hypothetical protein n=1 Tax=Nocardia sp. NBC_01009 TaxID=2975996 RepID=UPI003867C018|nr:hypothetical protein OHA42_24920 [Nocardia sp. NBC_01009]
MEPTFTIGEFIKAAASSPNQNCVRVARRDGWTAVWDDKLAAEHTSLDTALPGEQLLYFTDQQFDSFQEGLRAGRADLYLTTRHDDGVYVFRADAAAPQPVDGVELHFSAAEVEAFRSGVLNREFERTRFR